MGRKVRGRRAETDGTAPGERAHQKSRQQTSETPLDLTFLTSRLSADSRYLWQAGRLKSGLCERKNYWDLHTQHAQSKGFGHALSFPPQERHLPARGSAVPCSNGTPCAQKGGGFRARERCSGSREGWIQWKRRTLREKVVRGCASSRRRVREHSDLKALQDRETWGSPS